MPSLVEKTAEGKRGGVWEVKWTWMPVFLAMDKELVTAVDGRLNQLFAEGEPPMQLVLEKAVVDIICKKYPMTGLREALWALVKVDPTVRLQLVTNTPLDESETASLSLSASPKSEIEGVPR